MTTRKGLPTSVSEMLRGIRLFSPLALSIAAYGLVWGVLARQAGLSALDVALMSALVFSGTAQFVALTFWTPATLQVGALLMAVAIVNLRMALMTATLRPLMQQTPGWRALPLMLLVGDEQWALTMGEIAQGRGSVAFLLGTGVLAWVSWFGGTLAGRLLGNFVSDPVTYGLDFAFTATFIALLLGMWKGRGDLVPWLSAAAIAIVVSRTIGGQWYIVAGGLGGSFLGAWIESRRIRHVG